VTPDVAFHDLCRQGGHRSPASSEGVQDIMTLTLFHEGLLDGSELALEPTNAVQQLALVPDGMSHLPEIAYPHGYREGPYGGGAARGSVSAAIVTAPPSRARSITSTTNPYAARSSASKNRMWSVRAAKTRRKRSGNSS
jgi:hypothetical protein